MPYLTLFYRLIVRPLRGEFLRTSLTALAVALGVAVVLAIELAGDAAAGSFRSSIETLTGDFDFEVTAAGGIPPSTLTTLATLPYDLKLQPRLEEFAVLPGSNRTVPLIGVDMLSYALEADVASAGADATQEENGIWVGEAFHRKAGDRLDLLINDRLAEYKVQGVLPSGSGEAIVMDLAPLTKVLERNGSLDRITVRTSTDKSIGEWEKILRGALPSGIALARAGSKTNENRRMLEAFRWNLRVLSCIALVVGAFLIYNTISVSVVRRRGEIGILRALGAPRSRILWAFLGEAALFGLLGAVAGIVLGRVMASGAVIAVAATVESLYVSSRPAPIELTWQVALLGFALGLAVALLSALAPALEASRVVPVEAMSRGRREHQERLHRVRNLVVAALLAAAAALASRQQPVNGKPLFGYLAAMLMIAASALAIPAIVSGLASASAVIMRAVFGVEALLAARSLSGALRRTSVLVAALSTAIAMMAAVGIMVGSFRQTVLVWMDDRLQADLYLRPAGPPAADRHPTLSSDLTVRLAQLPQVAAADPFHAYEISYEGMPATLGAGDTRIAAKYATRPLLSGKPVAAIFDRLVNGDNVIVSEPFANKHKVKAGDTLALSLGGKSVTFKVLDIFYDYASERGYVIMDNSTLLKHLPIRRRPALCCISSQAFLSKMEDAPSRPPAPDTKYSSSPTARSGRKRFVSSTGPSPSRTPSKP